MEIFNYHPVTGVYIGKTEADESPLEPGKFLVPAYATEMIPPSERDGYDVVFKNDRWDYVEQEKPHEPTEEFLAQQEKKKRNGLLFASDYTQLADVQALMQESEKSAWLAYRQELRDVTQQPGFPREIIWPVKP